MLAIGLLCGVANIKDEQYSYVNRMGRLFDYIGQKFQCLIAPGMLIL